MRCCARLAAEAEANAAREAGLYDQYLLAIQARIKGKWQRPLSARVGSTASLPSCNCRRATS